MCTTPTDAAFPSALPCSHAHAKTPQNKNQPEAKDPKKRPERADEATQGKNSQIPNFRVLYNQYQETFAFRSYA